MDTSSFLHQITSSTTIHPDGTRTTTTDTAVWTLAHRGYSGSGRLDIWIYPTEQAALRAGAQAALEYGALDENLEACAMFDAGHYARVMELYEATDPGNLILRVQPAFLQIG